MLQKYNKDLNFNKLTLKHLKTNRYNNALNK